ncbi:MAG: acyl-[acyl-carrier-protein] thioesterase [Eubacteriaceae bacterium]
MSIKSKEIKRVACYECDSQGKILPTAVLNYFQELSTNQSDSLGVGTDFLKAKKIAWFLVKYHVHFNEYPCYKEEVTITTQATAMDKFCGNRRFTIENSKGHEIVVGDTQWLLINRETEKMDRIEDYKEFEVYECFNKESTFFKKLPPLKEASLERNFDVRYLDIDFNNHVNHVKYLAWAIEVLPIEVVKTRTLKEAKIIYKAQGFYGDTIRAQGKEIEKDHYRMDIINQKEQLLCQLELWLCKR